MPFRADEVSSKTLESRGPSTCGTPSGRFRSSDWAVGGLDRIVDAAVIAFALWTVVFHFAVVLNWPRNAAIALWFAALLAAATAAFRSWRHRRVEEGRAGRTTAPTGTGEPRGESQKKLAVSRATAVFFLAAATGVALLGAYFHGPDVWWLYSALIVALASAAVVTVTRRPAPSPRAEPSTSWGAVALVLAVATLFALGSAFTQRPDADDISYLSRAVHAEQRSGSFATHDTVYSDEAYGVGDSSTPLTAIEPLIGVGALLTPFTTPTVAYLVLGPAVSWLAVLALWRLLRTLGAPSPALATLGAALFLVLNGDRHASFGNFGFVRSWQGKAIFVAVVVPLIWHYALRWGKTADRSSWVGLLAANIAGMGLTTTAYLVAPTVTALGLVCSARGRGAVKRALVGGATLAYPLALLLVSQFHSVPSPSSGWTSGRVLGLTVAPAVSVVETFRAGGHALTGVVETRYAEILHGQWDHIFGDGLPMVVAVGSLLAAWLFVRDRAGRLALAAVPAVLVLVYFNPVMARIPGDPGSFEQAGGSWWRSVWVAPVPAAVGITVSSAVLISRAWLRRPLLVGLPLAMSVLMLMAGMSVLSHDNRGVRIGSLEWDVQRAPRAAAARALSLAERGEVVAAPDGVGRVLTTMTANVYPILVRDLQYSAPEFQPPSQRVQRHLVHRAITAGLGTDEVPAFQDALASLGIGVVVVDRDVIDEGSLAPALRAAGFAEVGADSHFSYWERH